MLPLIQDLRSVEKATTLFASLCVIVLMVCCSLTFHHLLVRLTSGWDLDYLPWLGGLVAVEALASKRRIYKTSELDTNPGLYRLVEVLMIVIATRLATMPWQSRSALKEVITGWQDNFLINFFDARFLFSLLVVILIWGLSSLYAEDLIDLEGDELALDAANLEGLVSDRNAAQQRLTGRVFTVGGGMVFINGLLRQEIIHIFGEAPALNQDAWHVVVYFVFGLVLLSLSQLANRRLAWSWERIPVKVEIVHQWIIYSVTFLVGVAILAFLLPTGYTIGFLPTLSYILGMFFTILYGLLLLILTPIFYVFSWIMSLFRVAAGDNPLDMIQPPQVIPPTVLDQAGQPAWLELLRSILFWVVILGVVGYTVYTYFHQNRELVSRLRRVRGLLWLIKAWDWLKLRIKVGAQRAPLFISEGLRRLRTALQPKPRDETPRYLSLRRLDTRQKVLFYYQALLRRAHEAHLPRYVWQTPKEYEDYLRDQMPPVEEDISSLTEAFVEARYSQHLVEEGQITAARQAWNRLRKYFRNRTIED